MKQNVGFTNLFLLLWICCLYLQITHAVTFRTSCMLFCLPLFIRVHNVSGVFFNVLFCCTKNATASAVSELHFLSVNPLFTRDLNARHNEFRNSFVLFRVLFSSIGLYQNQTVLNQVITVFLKICEKLLLRVRNQKCYAKFLFFAIVKMKFWVCWKTWTTLFLTSEEGGIRFPPNSIKLLQKYRLSWTRGAKCNFCCP
jgi:hypothetical protein